MGRISGLALLGVSICALGVAPGASAQSHTFTFDSGATDEGWGAPFGGDADKTLTITSVGGSNRMQVPNTSAFQETGNGSGTGNSLFLAIAAAAANPANYVVSYDWYVDTTQVSNATFLQLATYINTGSTYYGQNFPTAGKEVELGGTQLASGQVLSGTVTVPFAAYGAVPTADTFYRLGLIVNSGADAVVPVYYDNISVRPVPEPAALAAVGAGATALALRRRGTA